MKLRYYLGLFLASLAILASVAWFQHSPGYIDAEYYYAGSLRLAQGRGFSEVVLWNYLDDPAGLPHPSHAYWMPLASILGAIPLLIFPDGGFFSTRVIFILMAACVSPLAAALSYRLHGRKNWALLSGALAIFPGFYLPYLTTSDTFGICMLLGIAWFTFVLKLERSPAADPQKMSKTLRTCLFSGIVAGGFYLARAEGILWFLVSILVVIYWGWRSSSRRLKAGIWKYALGVCIGYLIVMAPWMLRNWLAFGSIFPPGSSHAFWLNTYDELFAYPAVKINFTHWWSSGLKMVLDVRGWALGQNLQTFLAVQGEILLAPLALFGFWRNRQSMVYRVAGVVWLFLLVLFTLVFPFQGVRGGFFHAGAGFQSVIWILAPSGLDRLIQWGKRVRHWNSGRSYPVFGLSLVVFMAAISALIAWQRVIGADSRSPAWDGPARAYQDLVTRLEALDVQPGETVMINNPPGYYLASGSPAIVVPSASPDLILDVAHRYGAKLLLLDRNHPEKLEEVYQHPHDQPGMNYLGSIGETLVFCIP